MHLCIRALAKDVPLTKRPSTGTAQQRQLVIFKVVLSAVIVISEVHSLTTKDRSRCCMGRLHIYCCVPLMDFGGSLVGFVGLQYYLAVGMGLKIVGLVVFG